MQITLGETTSWKNRANRSADFSGKPRSLCAQMSGRIFMLPKEYISALFAPQKETAEDGSAVTSMSCRLHAVLPRYCQKTHMQGSGHLLVPMVGLRHMLERRWRSCSKHTFRTLKQMLTTGRHVVGQGTWTTIHLYGSWSLPFLHLSHRTRMASTLLCCNTGWTRSLRS